MRRPGFTLLELLISMTIGTAIVASSWAAFNQIRLTTVRSKASTSINADAAVVHMALDNAFSACFHGSQFRLSVSNPGNPATAAFTLDLMNSMRELLPDTGRIVPRSSYDIDLVWNRFRFVVRNADGRSALYKAISSPSWGLTPKTAYQTITGIQMVADPGDASHSVPTWVNEDVVVGTTENRKNLLTVGPEVRRDRRRSMLDNDTRLIPNIPQSVYDSYKTGTSTSGAFSDDQDLDARLQLVTDNISHLRLEIVDYLGNVTRCGIDGATGAPNGLSYADKAGDPITPVLPDPAEPLAPNVWSSTVRVVDGLWSDGRPDPCPYNPSAITLPNPALERPALIRVSFRMHERISRTWREFSFSFPTSPLTVRGIQP